MNRLKIRKKEFYIVLVINTLLNPLFLKAQNQLSTLNSIDVLNYSIELKVNDSTDRIEVIEFIDFKWLDTTKRIEFDLASVGKNGKGMLVKKVQDGDKELRFSHIMDKLLIENLNALNRKTQKIEIHYSGIPSDGLVIGKNRYGERTFFGDNWPNRAHEWFVCIDHPSDKATVSFKVIVPNKYKVIANGSFDGKTSINSKESMYSYSTTIPLPTKVIVIGIADFEVKELGISNGILLSSWVYPENSSKSFYDLDIAPQVLDFYVNYIAPYEFEKLANVQSTTRFGGMENAGCIFYDEFSLTGKRTSEALIAHEIAHQWFGNSASEKEWKDIWLSEGFATYFTNLYLENTYGLAALQKQMEKDRSQVITFNKKYPKPIVDSTYVDLMNLLNANSYQKGSWFLHMLRRKIGDENFKNGIKKYYQKYRLSNASTDDFYSIMEEESKMELKDFFKQWLYTAGHPQLCVNSKISNKKVDFTIKQVQDGEPFVFPLTIQIVEKNGNIIEETIIINQKAQDFVIKTGSKIKSYKIDPNCDLLFELVNK